MKGDKATVVFGGLVQQVGNNVTIGTSATLALTQIDDRAFVVERCATLPLSEEAARRLAPFVYRSARITVTVEAVE